MKFKITARQGRFGKFNPRNEKHGTELVPAADITVTITGGKRDFDILYPHPKIKLSDVIWVDKRIALPFVNPLPNARTPENVTFTVWDQATAKRKPLEFENCKIKIGPAEIKEKQTFETKLTIQIHDDPDEHSARLRALMDNVREFALEAQQEDFFDQDEDEKPATPQKELLEKEEEEEEEEDPEDEDDEDDEDDDGEEEEEEEEEEDDED